MPGRSTDSCVSGLMGLAHLTGAAVTTALNELLRVGQFYPPPNNLTRVIDILKVL